jgi:hypothetical protein
MVKLCLKKKSLQSWAQWLILDILATQWTEIRRIAVRAQPGKKLWETHFNQ